VEERGRTFPSEDLRTELAAQRDGPRERAHELDNLGNMIVVLVVPSSGMGVEEIIAREELKELRRKARSASSLPLPPSHPFPGENESEERTIADALQISTLVPHLAPKMASGERYCLVWISFVKWRSIQLALPRSAILTVMRSRVEGS
jgi:hypothetical protein